MPAHRNSQRRILSLVTLASLHVVLAVPVARADTLADGFANPPPEARLRAYWWWLNGNVTEKSITRDLKEMADKGFGGALICDAGGAEQWGNARVPHGPTFFTPEWRELYKHALREAKRLGLEMSLNIQSGWNLGGPMVVADDAPKTLVWTDRVETGPVSFAEKLNQPKARDAYYRDLFVLAYRVKPPSSNETTRRPPLLNWEQKAMLKPLHFSAPDTAPLLVEYPSVPGEEDTRVEDIVDLSARLDADGTLHWEVPAGNWEILRIGCTLNDHCRVSTCSDGWNGYALDPFDAGAFRRYWEAVVEPLIADAGPLAGTTLKYLHTDSWEVEVANWTPTLREEFKRRRQYDLLPWLPVIAGRIVNSREESNRFLYDFRRTMGDLAIDNHYRLFRDGAHKHGLRIHPESGGPHAVPIDAQQCLGFNDAPMSEFWAWSWQHRIGDQNRFFVKQPASAAHVYGRKLVLAEGFTTIGPHWQERLWDNLKPSFDYACTEGLNLLVWHAFVCSPESEGIPGQQYFAGTHLNPLVTWWGKSRPFFDYINRCQFLLQQGSFVADAAYYYGNHVPNFAQLRSSDPARLGEGHDYDVFTEEALLQRASVQEGRLVLPDGMSYRVLVLPDREAISLPVLRKVRELVEAGATVVGPRPVRAVSLSGYPQCDAEVQRLANELWGADGGTAVQRKVGRGRIIAGKTAREVLLSDGARPDFAFNTENGLDLEYIHRRVGDAEIYFISNRSNVAANAICTFRVSGHAPELWDAVTGERKMAAAYEVREGRTMVPLAFDPCGSWFVLFREPSANHPAVAQVNWQQHRTVTELSGPWQVSFDERWGGPGSVQFDSLTDWTKREEPGIKFYSGTATYTKAFQLPDSPSRSAGSDLLLDLGEVCELAEVKLNGKSLGVVWTPPFRVNVTDAVKTGDNKLEVEVVNFWPNRIIGDAALPVAQRRTRTNIRKLTAESRLMRSGLLGPVQLMESQPIQTASRALNSN